jgi:hypothetical protein
MTKLLALIYKLNIIMVLLRERLQMENIIQFQEKTIIYNGLKNTIIIADISLFFLTHLYFYKYLILFVVVKLKINSSFLKTLQKVEYSVQFSYLLLFYKF